MRMSPRMVFSVDMALSVDSLTSGCFLFASFPSDIKSSSICLKYSMFNYRVNPTKTHQNKFWMLQISIVIIKIISNICSGQTPIF